MERKLSPAQKAKIREMYADDDQQWSMADLAAMAGVSTTLILRIIHEEDT